jgi:hypothetical protein
MMAAMTSNIIGLSRKAVTKDRIVSRKYTETNGHCTAAMTNATADEKPLPTPRMRVGYISAE